MPRRSTFTEYSCRVHPDNFGRLLEERYAVARPPGVALGKGESFDLDFHAIPYHGDDAPAEKHYVSSRSRKASSRWWCAMSIARLFVCADAAVRKDSRHDRLLHRVDFRERRTGALPRQVFFDSTFTTYANLQTPTERGIAFPTLRRRSARMVTALQERPASEWKRLRLTSAGPHLPHPAHPGRNGLRPRLQRAPPPDCQATSRRCPSPIRWRSLPHSSTTGTPGA